jgi:outer membrane protein assembly factor BamB
MDLSVFQRLAQFAIFCLFLSPVFADDWPQWMGPHRDSVWREEGVLTEFPKEGLEVKWRVPVAGGYSGPAVAEGLVYVTDFLAETGEAFNDPNRRAEVKGKERVLCFDAKDRSEVWKHEYDCEYNISYPAGPRATPTVQAGKVYALGAEGNLFCLEAKTGRELWSKDFNKDYATQTPTWGYASHPLVVGDKLICVVGGQGSVAVAFHKDTGKELWRAISASAPGYAPPTMIEAAKTKQLLIWDADKLNSLNPDTGKAYWSLPLKPDFEMSIMAPRKEGNLLFASGIGNVGALIELASDEPKAEIVWKGDTRTALYAANSTPFLENGTLYGTDCRPGIFRAVDLKTGERLWETFKPTTGGDRPAGHGTAFVVKHQPSGQFFLFSETGDLIVAELSREEYKEISRFHVLEPTGEAFGRKVVWSHPAFANQSVFARNDKELVCVSLKK